MCTRNEDGQALERAVILCAARKVRLTGLRRRVLECVLGGNGPVKAYAILDALRAEGDTRVTPASVYRALDFLVRQAIVHRVHALNAYVACEDGRGHRDAAFLLVCSGCGHSVEFSDPAILSLLTGTTAERGFVLQGHTVEMQGVCRECSAASG